MGPEDSDVLRALFLSSNPGLLHLGLPEDQLNPLVSMQQRAQEQGYFSNFPNSNREVVLNNRQAIGVIWTNRAQEAIHLLDITIHPDHRGQGIGSHLIKGLMAAEIPVTLSVVSNNPARDLYTRLGFVEDAFDGVRYTMIWVPGP